MAESVLVADDEAGVRESLAEVLRDAGYAVETAVDGSAALAALDTNDFAVVITDLRMPGADGLDVLRKLREVAPQTVPLVMTAHGAWSVEALSAGADYILKPIVPDDVLAKTAACSRTASWPGRRRCSAGGRTPLRLRSPDREERPTGGLPPGSGRWHQRTTVLITGDSGTGKEGGSRDPLLQPVVG
jgi:DNA-binding NtrC family response regulator